MNDAPASRTRLDAVALTSAAAVAAGATAYITHPPFFALKPVLGPDTDGLVAPVAAAVGYAGFVLLGGAAALVGLYARRRGPGRLLVRGLGWGTLAAAGAVAADLRPASFPGPGSVFGPGGSVGAFLRTTLADAAGPAAVAAGWFGLLLAADGLVRGAVKLTATFLAGLFRGARAGNKLVEAGSLKVLDGLTAAAATLQRDPDPDSVTLTVPPVAPPAGPVQVAVPASAPIPIHIHVHTPPPVGELKLPPPAPAASAPYELPPLTLLQDPDPSPVEDREESLRERAALLEKTFADFGISVKVVGIHPGPVITQYEIALETGLRLNKVTALADDVALNLRVPSVRIVAPLPGRNTVGVEVPNEHRLVVRLKELIVGTTAKAAKFKLPVFLGKDVEGKPLVYDLAAMPHLLIAGRTGTGKSVCLNTIILSLLYTRQPDDCRLILIDPKKVELSDYGKIPHLMHPVVTDEDKTERILAWAVDKMEERYEWLRRARVRNIAAFNDLSTDEIYRRIDPTSEEERQAVPRRMPYVTIIIDEVGDLLMSKHKKELEAHIIRLAQKSRAAGIHLILATQKPTVDVITGLIKSNLPARVCFQVASRADSMVVLDEKGADKLLGMGDMLFLQPGTSTIIRGQGAYVGDAEIERTVTHLETDEPNYESELLNLKAKDKDGSGGGIGEKLRERDDNYEQAVEIVIREQRGSTSLLQRAMGIGYGKASRLIDFMAEDGIVGGFNGSSARDVLVTREEWESRRAAA